MQKMMDQEFWNSNSVILKNFLKFSKRHHAVPLWPIWAIMVAAKLDHSRVLVTKFHQNRSTLNDRSAGQRHTHTETDRQTNSAENNGTSGLQSGQHPPRNFVDSNVVDHWHITYHSTSGWTQLFSGKASVAALAWLVEKNAILPTPPLSDKRLGYRRGTAWCAMSVEILSTAAQLYKNCIWKNLQ